MNIRELRNKIGITQKEAAKSVGVSLRSYVDYENNPSKIQSRTYKYIFNTLSELYPLDETHGVLTMDFIRKTCSDIFDKYKVDFCILFGSYAKGTAKETSDVDLLLSSRITGLKFYGLVEELRQALGKKVDLLDIKQLSNNTELLSEILKYGEKIYG